MVGVLETPGMTPCVLLEIVILEPEFSHKQGKLMSLIRKHFQVRFFLQVTLK